MWQAPEDVRRVVVTGADAASWSPAPAREPPLELTLLTTPGRVVEVDTRSTRPVELLDAMAGFDKVRCRRQRPGTSG
jgi:hypothetical protein